MNTQQNIRIDVVGDANDFVGGARAAAQELNELKESAYKAAAGFASFVSAGALMGAASSLIDAQKAAQKLGSSLEYSTGNAGQASIALDYLREVTRKLGVDFGTASDAYAKFAAASKGAGISAEAVKSVFEGVAAASMKLGLSAEETSGALLALSQMASKGVVSAEELRGQLGERLPGAMKLAANAMGVTQAELSKMLETGQIMASDFLPKFGDALRNEFQGPAAGLVAEINRLNSAWEDWKRSLADSDGGGFKWLTRGINESSAAMRELGKEAGFVQKLLTAIGGFQFGAAGKGKFDTQQLQQEALEKLSMVRQGRVAMESRHLNYLEQEQYRDLGRQEKALRDQIQQLAERRGKETGLQLPDLAGEMQAQALKRKDALSAYLKDVSSEKDKAVAAENERWNAVTAAIGTAGAEYEKALAAHNAKLAEIAKKGAEKSGAKPKADDSVFQAWYADFKDQEKVNAALEHERQRAADLLASYGREDAIAVQRIARSAELAAMSERERTVAEAVYAAQDKSSRRQEQIIKQISDETERTRALSEEKSLLASYIDKATEAAGKSYDKQRSFESGWDKALQRYVDDVGNASKTADSLFGQMADGMANAMTQFATTGKTSFSSLANSIIADIIRMQARAASAGAMQWLSGLFGPSTSSAGPSAAAGGGTWLGNTSSYSLNAMGNHTGGIAGAEATFMRSVPAGLFDGAPRLHTGGIAGDEVPTILRKGEGVFTEGQMKALGGGSNVTVNVINQSGGQATQRERSDGRGNKIIDVLIEQVKSSLSGDVMSGNGAFPAALERSYGLGRQAGAY